MHILKKNIFPIVVLLLAVSVIGYFLLGEKSLDGVRQDLKPVVENIASDTNVSNKGKISKICYSSKIDNNINYVEVNYAENAIVTGFVSRTSANKKLYEGNFIGAQNGKFINAIYAEVGDEKELQKQIMYKIGENNITRADNGEMVENESGLKMYKDIKALIYPEKNILVSVDCEKNDKN